MFYVFQDCAGQGEAYTTFFISSQSIFCSCFPSSSYFPLLSRSVERSVQTQSFLGNFGGCPFPKDFWQIQGMIFLKYERNSYRYFQSSVSGSFICFHDCENQVGELELFSNFGRSGPFGNIGQAKLWIMLLKYGTQFYLFSSAGEVMVYIKFAKIEQTEVFKLSQFLAVSRWLIIYYRQIIRAYFAVSFS